VKLRRFGDREAAAAALAAELIPILQAGISDRGRASLAVPGGGTPAPLFRALRDAPLDWASVAVTLTDERWVPPDHPASNAAQLRRELLRGRAAAAAFFPLYDGGAGAAVPVDHVWQSLRIIARPFDGVVLGMGEDGHFASLFAGNAGLDAALDPAGEPACVAMHAPAAPEQRISLNLPALLQLVSGDAKLALLQRAANAAGSADLPIAALLAAHQPAVEIFWAP
jgi:6-phosphogluconolactonase